MAEREQSLSRHTTLIKTKALKNFVAAGAAALLLLAATPVWAADAAVKIGNFTLTGTIVVDAATGSIAQP
jgi:type 1 fimbria pilin